MKKADITPHNSNVVVEVTKLPTTINDIHVGEQSEMTKVQIEFYYGKAIKIGSTATSKNQCPELKVGDGVVFQQIAGYQVPTTDSYCKVIGAYNVVAITSDLENMNAETITPTGDRVLVEIIGEKLVSEDGIHDESKADPRESATQKGRVISCAKGAAHIEKGTIVAFDPYCGNLIVNDK